MRNLAAFLAVITGEIMKLDKKKPYAEIIGSTDGSKYEQDGVIYDIHGEPLVKEQEKPKRGRPALNKDSNE